MNKSTSIQILFVGVMMALVSTVFLMAQKSLPKRPDADNPYDPNRPQWQTALASDKKAACTTILAQLNAFDRNDYLAATELQAPGMAHSTRAPEQLRSIVQSFYPEFAHYKSVEFKEAKCNHARNEMSVHILLTGKDKFTVSAYYFIYIINGKYLVGGVNGGEHPGRPLFNRRFYRPGEGHEPGRDGPGPDINRGAYIGPGHGRPGPYPAQGVGGPPPPNEKDYQRLQGGPPPPQLRRDISGPHNDDHPQ